MRFTASAILYVTVPATIITSLWRGENRITSAPNRAMSNRELAAAINSIAQHAKPIGMGQREFLRIQLIAESSRVTITFPSILESYEAMAPTSVMRKMLERAAAFSSPICEKFHKRLAERGAGPLAKADGERGLLQIPDMSRSPLTFWRASLASFAFLVSIAALAQAEADVGGPRQHKNWGYDAPDWTAPVVGWIPLEPGEHPRLVFRAADLARMKSRAETPEGRAIVDKLKALLGGKFTLWHPAGNGMLFQLTGEQMYADLARSQMADILDKKLHDAKDGRYGFDNPGSGGAMRAGPAIAAVGLAYDLNYGGWEPAFREKVAAAILNNPFTSSIAAQGPIMPSCNHFGAAVGGVGAALFAIQGDPSLDGSRVKDLLAKIVKQARDEISIGYGDRGYYFEGHQCGRISSNTGLFPFIQAYRISAGRDLVSGLPNARWLAAKWIYEFALNPDGTYTNAQRGMYCRDFPRGGMWSEQGDFAMGFGVCPAEYIPALKWVFNHQVEAKGQNTYDVLDYPHQAIYALANWPIDIAERNPSEQPNSFPRVLHDTAAGYLVFRNGWSDAGKDICVSALLGTHPTHQNGRGMASGGSIYVYGKGLGWAGDHARYRLPGMFYESYPIYTRFEDDGSGVVSALAYPERLNKFNLDIAECSTHPTSLAVDFSGKCGAELLVAIAGPMAGYQVEYWMDIKPAKIADISGAGGYATKTTEVTLAGQKAFVMTLQKGDAPKVTQDGDRVLAGDRTVAFDGGKIVLGP